MRLFFEAALALNLLLVGAVLFARFFRKDSWGVWRAVILILLSAVAQAQKPEIHGSPVGDGSLRCDTCKPEPSAIPTVFCAKDLAAAKEWSFHHGLLGFTVEPDPTVVCLNRLVGYKAKPMTRWQSIFLSGLPDPQGYAEGTEWCVDDLDDEECFVRAHAVWKLSGSGKRVDRCLTLSGLDGSYSTYCANWRGKEYDDGYYHQFNSATNSLFDPHDCVAAQDCPDPANPDAHDNFKASNSPEGAYPFIPPVVEIDCSGIPACPNNRNHITCRCAPEPIDVPAIHRHLGDSCEKSNCSFLNRRIWTCADPRRVLEQAEDQRVWCHLPQSEVKP